jgi:hypothetical protein
MVIKIGPQIVLDSGEGVNSRKKIFFFLKKIAQLSKITQQLYVVFLIGKYIVVVVTNNQKKALLLQKLLRK